MRRFVPYALTVAALLLGSSPSFAQTQADRAKARKLAYEGQDALDRKDYITAVDRFTQADAIVHAPTLVLGLAQGLAGEGKLRDAREAFLRVVREPVPPKSPPAFAKAVEEARFALEALDRRIPKVRLRVTGPTTYVVALDGSNVDVDKPIPIDPGKHAVRASAEGFVAVEKSFEAREGDTTDLTLELSSGVATGPAAPVETKRAWQRPVGFAVGGVGVAGLAVGAVTGILAISKHGDLAKSCTNGVCASPAAQSELSSYHTIGTISTIGFVAGGVLAAGGVVLIVTAPKRDQGAAPPAASLAHVSVGLGRLELGGGF